MSCYGERRGEKKTPQWRALRSTSMEEGSSIGFIHIDTGQGGKVPDGGVSVLNLAGDHAVEFADNKTTHRSLPVMGATRGF